MRALIVDDEPIARRRLSRMLRRIEGVEVVGEAADGDEALDVLDEVEADVVLLDIRMPGTDGLMLAQHEALPPVIFTTAYDEYAVKAFDACAVDYLMKPVQQERLERALSKVAQRPSGAGDVSALLQKLVEERTERTDHRITARQGDTLHVFDARGIARFYASEKYSVFQRDGKEYLLELSLNTLEERLTGLDFVRVHRSELISLDHVRTLHLQDGGAVAELSTGERARVSRRHLARLKRALRME